MLLLSTGLETKLRMTFLLGQLPVLGDFYFKSFFVNRWFSLAICSGQQETACVQSKIIFLTAFLLWWLQKYALLSNIRNGSHRFLLGNFQGFIWQQISKMSSETGIFSFFNKMSNALLLGKIFYYTQHLSIKLIKDDTRKAIIDT